MKKMFTLSAAAIIVVGIGVASSFSNADGVGKTIQPAALQQIYSCWFDNPYDYMFASKSLSGDNPNTLFVKTAYFGTFIGGINGILNYGGVLPCIAGHLGKNVNDYPFGETSSIEALSGLKLLSDASTADLPFKFYNPEIIAWGHQWMIPPTDMNLAGVAVTTIYKSIFSTFFRCMTETYAWLIHGGKQEEYKDLYWKEANKIGQYGTLGGDAMDWLNGKFANVIPGYNSTPDWTSFTEQMAIGFWLRRSIDGTAAELWTGLKKIMTAYDKEWYEGLKRTYTSAAIAW